MPTDGDILAVQIEDDAAMGGSARAGSLATSTPRDTASPSTDDTVMDTAPIGSWSGWAELENDPVGACYP